MGGSSSNAASVSTRLYTEEMGVWSEGCHCEPSEAILGVAVSRLHGEEIHVS
jgi:hypothetical protein